MLRLALRNLMRRPVRHGLAIVGLAAAVAVQAALLSFGFGYRQALGLELERMGMQLMLVPLGCPYDAAARVLKGSALDASLPASALEIVRRDPDVSVAAPLVIVNITRENESRADVWVGLDESTRQLKPWWRVKAGTNWFSDLNSVILGSEAAEVEMRSPGDKLFSPETGAEFIVAGVLERSGTSDDSLFFVPLKTAQRIAQQPRRLSAIAIRLRDPAMLGMVTDRLQHIPGAQVVTLTEMMGTFLNLVGSVRTLSRALALIALTVSVLTVFNTLLAAVVERTGELSLMRAVGASRWQVFGLLTTESTLLATAGSLLGLAVVLPAGWAIENAVREWVSFVPQQPMIALTGGTVLNCLLIGLAVGLAAGVYPAWHASRIQPAAALKEV